MVGRMYTMQDYELQLGDQVYHKHTVWPWSVGCFLAMRMSHLTRTETVIWIVRVVSVPECCPRDSRLGWNHLEPEANAQALESCQMQTSEWLLLVVLTVRIYIRSQGCHSPVLRASMCIPSLALIVFSLFDRAAFPFCAGSQPGTDIRQPGHLEAKSLHSRYHSHVLGRGKRVWN